MNHYNNCLKIECTSDAIAPNPSPFPRERGKGLRGWGYVYTCMIDADYYETFTITRRTIRICSMVLSVCAFLTGSFADIGGTVTDTGGEPLAGAVVCLEKGRQTATSGSDGRFTLTGISSVRHHGPDRFHKLFSRIVFCGNRLKIRSHGSVILDHTVFSAAGTMVEARTVEIEAGVNCISLPRTGSGIFFHILRYSGNTILVRQVVSGTRQRHTEIWSPANPKGSSRCFADRMFEDVLAVEKEHFLHYRLRITAPDTHGVQVRLIRSAGTVTDREGTMYQTVKIGDQVWMTENLRTTTCSDGSSIPLVTADSAWSARMTPAYCFNGNSVDADSIRKFGALYNWYAVAPDYIRKLVPEGWHLPDTTEWNTLENWLIANGGNRDGSTSGNRIAKAMAAQTDWTVIAKTGAVGDTQQENNRSGFSALPGGYRNTTGTFFYGENGYWWSATIRDSSLAYFRGIKYDSDDLYHYGFSWRCGLSVRLVKDR